MGWLDKLLRDGAESATRSSQAAAESAGRAVRVADLAAAANKAQPQLRPVPSWIQQSQIAPSAPKSPPPPPPPPPRQAGQSAASKSEDAPMFRSDHPYLKEWDRFTEAGIPNEYRTYGTYGLLDPSSISALPIARDPAVMAMRDKLGELFGGAYVDRPYVDGANGENGTYLFASRPKADGSQETFVHVYGPDPGGRRGTRLYSVPAEDAARMGLEEKLSSLGYVRAPDFSRGRRK